MVGFIVICAVTGLKVGDKALRAPETDNPFSWHDFSGNGNAELYIVGSYRYQQVNAA